LLEVPMDFLAEPACRGRHLRETRGVAQNVPHFDFQGHRIWGATAMMLAEFIAIWREAAAAEGETPRNPAAAAASPKSPSGSRRPPR
jgi:hypothetical protein